MAEKLTKELADKLMSLEGEARGMHLYSDIQYVINRKGKEGVEKVETVLRDIGYPIDYSAVKKLGFYPMGTRPLSLIASQEAFGWGDEDVRGLCKYASSVSLIVKLYMKYFYSLDKVVEKAPEIFREYFSIGDLSIPDYSTEERYAVVQIKNLDLHSSFCRCMEGYLEGFIKMVVRAADIRCVERKCVFNGDDVHEFYLTWGNG